MAVFAGNSLLVAKKLTADTCHVGKFSYFRGSIFRKSIFEHIIINRGRYVAITHKYCKPGRSKDERI